MLAANLLDAVPPPGPPPAAAPRVRRAERIESRPEPSEAPQERSSFAEFLPVAPPVPAAEASTAGPPSAPDVPTAPASPASRIGAGLIPALVSPGGPVEASAVAAGAASPQPQASLPAPPDVDPPPAPGLMPDRATLPAAPPLTTAPPPPALVANLAAPVSPAAASLTSHQTGVRSIVGTVSEPAPASANGPASPVGASAPNVVFTAAALSSGGGDAGGAPDDHAGETLLLNVDGAGAAEPELTPFEPTAPTLATERREAPPPVRATSETAAALAAEMARKLDARVTRFELRLDPGGLGQVQVALEIQSSGEVTAHLRFDRPEAMHELRARADELRETLQQAGFSVASGSLSFESRGDGHRQASGGPTASTFGGLLAPASEPPPPSRAPRRAAGLDLRI